MSSTPYTNVVSCGGFMYKLETNQTFICQNETIFVEVMPDMKFTNASSKTTLSALIVCGLMVTSFLLVY